MTRLTLIGIANGAGRFSSLGDIGQFLFLWPVPDLADAGWKRLGQSYFHGNKPFSADVTNLSFCCITN